MTAFRQQQMKPLHHIKKLIFLCLGVLNLAVSAQEPSAMPRSANAEYQLTDSQIADLAAMANQGDTKAAMRLGAYYDFVAGDHDSAYKWLRKAADDGDPKAQFNLGVRTLGKGGSEACRDARYWFSLAKQNGFAKAEKELDRLKGCKK